MKHKYLVWIMALVMVGTAIGFYTQDTFIGGSIQNKTLAGNGNSTLYFRVPLDAIIKNASLKLTAYETDYIYQDTFDDASFNNTILNYSINARLSDGTVAEILEYNDQLYYNYKKRSPGNPGNRDSNMILFLNDSSFRADNNFEFGIGNLSLNSIIEANNQYFKFGVYLLDDEHMRAYQQNKTTVDYDPTTNQDYILFGSKIQFNNSAINYSGIKIFYNSTSQNITISNSSGLISINNTDSLQKGTQWYLSIIMYARVPEKAPPKDRAFFNISISNIEGYTNSTPYNPQLYIGEVNFSSEWSYNDTYNRSSKINFTQTLMDELNKNSCSCSMCYTASNVCNIPITLTSESAGILEISDLGINYTYNWSINNCTNGTPTINFTVINETDSSSGQADISGTFSYGRYDGLNGWVYKNYSFDHKGRTNTHFCIYPNGTSVTSDIQIQYINETYYDFFTQDTNLTNVIKHVSLYLVGGTTLVTFNVKDTTDNNIENAIIIIDKYNVGTNSYKTVEILQTDEQGNTVGNLILNTAFYRFTVNYGGVTYLVDGPTKVTSTSKFFRIDLAGGDWWDDYESYKGVNFNLTFTNATKNFNLVYNDPNMVISHACLKAERLNATGNVLLGDTCLQTYSGNILVNIGTDVANRQYVATAYITIDGNNFTLDMLTQEYLEEYKFYDDDDHYGVFITFLVALTLVMVGIFHPVAAIILMLVAIGGSMLIGFYYIPWPMFMALVVLGGITLYKIGSAR